MGFCKKDNNGRKKIQGVLKDTDYTSLKWKAGQGKVRKKDEV